MDKTTMEIVFQEIETEKQTAHIMGAESDDPEDKKLARLVQLHLKSLRTRLESKQATATYTTETMIGRVFDSIFKHAMDKDKKNG